MKKPQNITYYQPFEEKLNIISHGFGFVLSIIGLVVLIYKSVSLGNSELVVSFSIFGASMVLLYAASTFYHSAKTDKKRHLLNILDHASIYILIAGTYTPYALVTLHGKTGWTILIIVWSIAFLGVILKLFYAGRYQVFSTIMYVLMGWIIIFAMRPLADTLPYNGLLWLAAGGISYTIGAVVFSIDKLHLNHAIFHIFVLLGSFCHYMSILLYVLPNKG